MDKNDIKNSADLFLYKAIVDLNTSKYLFEAFESGKIEIDLETIMFHLQQCTEKLMKSLLSKNKIRVFKTHQLDNLLDLIYENDINILNNLEELISLSEYAVEGRYAIIHDDMEDAHKYIEILDKLMKFVEKEISIETK